MLHTSEIHFCVRYTIEISLCFISYFIAKIVPKFEGKSWACTKIAIEMNQMSYILDCFKDLDDYCCLNNVYLIVGNSPWLYVLLLLLFLTNDKNRPQDRISQTWSLSPVVHWHEDGCHHQATVFQEFCPDLWWRNSWIQKGTSSPMPATAFPSLFPWKRVSLDEINHRDDWRSRNQSNKQKIGQDCC